MKYSIILSSLVFASILTTRTVALSPDAWIGGGKTLTEKEDTYKAVVLTKAEFWCTATFLNDTTIITANHCIGHEKDGTGYLTVAGVRSVRVFENETFLSLRRQQRPWAELGPQDVVLAVFPKGTAEKLGIKEFGKLAPRPPFALAKVTMVGFGLNDVPKKAGLGVKRWGENQIRSVGDMIGIFGLSVPMQGTGQDATGANGDSGGPLFDRANEIVGITSYGTMDPKQTHHWTYYSNAHNIQHERLYRNAILCDAVEACAANFPNSGVSGEDATKPRVKPKPKDKPTCVTGDEEKRLAALARAKAKAAIPAADDEELAALVRRVKNNGVCEETTTKAGMGCLTARDLSAMYRMQQQDYLEELGEEEQAVLKAIEDRLKEEGVCAEA